MRVLGIDLGAVNLGISIVSFISAENNNLLYKDTLILHQPSIQDKVSALYPYLNSLIEDYLVNAVGYEATVMKSKNGRIMDVLTGSIIQTSLMKGIPCFEFSPSRVKSIVAGKGHASKREIEFAVNTILHDKIDYDTNHESDAVAVAYCTYFTLCSSKK